MKALLVVGGSRGIGKAFIQLILNEYKIICFSRSKPDFDHPNINHYEIDILNDKLPELHTCDCIVYFPGSINLKPISRLSIDDFRNDFEINVIGAVRTIQKYLPQLKNSTNGNILLFSTVATKLGMPFHASIAASKSAVEGLVKSLGAELAPKIRVNAIAPTVTDTDLASKLLRNDKMKENITQRHPLKKFLNPIEVAEMAKFIISPNASSISGQIFDMDCGIVSFKI